jgi:conjugal transfer pilus assembly protein TraA
MRSNMRKKAKKFLAENGLMILTLALVILPSVGFPSETGDKFKDVYNFVYEAATGYLGRAIAITGGLIGLGAGASMGKALPAISGVVLAVFGALGPSIINSVFSSAII